MTTLYQHLNELKTDALKRGDSFTFTKLGTILGEAKQVATKKENRDPTDEEVISIIKKGLEGIAEMLKHEKEYDKAHVLIVERDLLTKFMPTQLSELEIKTLIENAALDNLGKIMGLFKKNFQGKYDGNVVRNLAEQFLAKSA
jgi:uncharacterized protein YqeY